MKITIKWKVEQDDFPVRGNALASGDEALDKAVEDVILARLDRGDVWAWAWVQCEASTRIGDDLFIGRDSIGGCSYKDRKEFMADYGKSVRDQAITDLKCAMRRAVSRAKAAVEGIEAFDRNHYTIEEEQP